MFFNFFTNMTV